MVIFHLSNTLGTMAFGTEQEVLDTHQGPWHTPSIAFRHLPPISARFGYATEGALFISAQLSTDAVSAVRKVWVLIRLWKQPSTHVNMRCIHTG